MIYELFQDFPTETGAYYCCMQEGSWKERGYGKVKEATCRSNELQFMEINKMCLLHPFILREKIIFRYLYLLDVTHIKPAA